MKNLNPYLTFGGNCNEAMEYYKSLFGGELKIQKVGETPMAGKTSEGDDKVMHAELSNGAFTIFASDMLSAGAIVPGNMISLTIGGDDETLMRATFDKLASEGSLGHAFEAQFWGDIFGDLTDKYGIRWMFNCSKPKA